MQSIITKYHGPTNHRRSRVSAQASGMGKRVMIEWDNYLSIDENHKLAAVKLMQTLDWRGKFVGGSYKEGMIFVNMHNYDFMHIER